MFDYETGTAKEAMAQRIIAIRKAKKWSATFMAQAVGATPQRWYMYEKGRSTPPTEVLAKIKQLTGATADFILFGDTSGMPFELMNLIGNQVSVAEVGVKRA